MVGRKKSGPAKGAGAGWLVFVDTNILLDFYRLSGESATRQMQALERHQDRLITSEQIRMEFLKNRQKVVLESKNKFLKPNQIFVPPVIKDLQRTKMLPKHVNDAVKAHAQLTSKIEDILRDPSRHDPVYQSFMRIFTSDSELNLKRPNNLRFVIRRLARKRFLLGYPPRKSTDVSIGDAINWEWIIWCAQKSKEKQNIVIVSRDSDYGIIYDGKPILNDWLFREFRDRVSQKRKIVLTNRLTESLKFLDEQILPEDESEETKILEEDLGSRRDEERQS